MASLADEIGCRRAFVRASAIGAHGKKSIGTQSGRDADPFRLRKLPKCAVCYIGSVRLGGVVRAGVALAQVTERGS
jgi:hypothetical protein